MSKKIYWVSVIMLDKTNNRPISLALGDCVTDIETAKEIIKRARNNYTIYSAWINTINENEEKQTVFHECYVNAIGVIERGV